jgi:hypothetical protein
VVHGIDAARLAVEPHLRVDLTDGKALTFPMVLDSSNCEAVAICFRLKSDAVKAVMAATGRWPCVRLTATQPGTAPEKWASINIFSNGYETALKVLAAR